MRHRSHPLPPVQWRGEEGSVDGGVGSLSLSLRSGADSDYATWNDSNAEDQGPRVQPA